MKKWVVKVEEELYPLLPEFLSNRWEDRRVLKICLNTKDFERIRRIGHLLQGTPACFGYKYLAALGKQLEKAAIEKKEGKLFELVGKYESFLKNHTIAYKNEKSDE